MSHTQATVTGAPPAEAVVAFQERCIDHLTSTLLTFSVHLGHRLGYYQALATKPQTAPELATTTATHARYVREWLEHQTVNGILAVDDPNADPDARTYTLPAAHLLVLADADSLDFLAPVFQAAVGATSIIDHVEEAYRTGAGIPFGAYGPHMRDGQAGQSRAMFLHLMGEWIHAMPDVAARLTSDTPARVADIGCGAAWSSIGIAQHFPNVHVDGFDLDESSVQAARANIATAASDRRIAIHHADAGSLSDDVTYDLVTAFECVHDLADPVSVLRTMRKLAGKNGAVMVMDENVGERFDPANPGIEPLMYGWSVLHCLPGSLDGTDPAGTGTVIRPRQLEAYAKAAGFTRVEILPIKNDFFRFYRLHQ